MTEHVRKTLETANDRFKHSFGRVFWASLIVAAMSHFAFFTFFPTLEAEIWSLPQPHVPTILPPVVIQVPPAPDAIDQPQPPTALPVEIKEVPHGTAREVDRPEAPPPPPSLPPALADSGFAVISVEPELRDPRAAERSVQQVYPDLLRDAGLGGTVMVRARVDTLGRVVDAVLAASSGVRSLDEAALTAVRRFEFTPALNRDRKVEVWVLQSITFRAR